MTRTATGPESPTRTETKFSVIGERNRQIEGRHKVTGQALYTDDLVLPRMLIGKILRSPHAHARIRNIDPSRALAIPGVHAVITGRDVAIPYGIIPWTRDEYPLALEKALFVGDGVAALAAEDELTAEEALDAIDVEYEVLPPVLSVETALAHPENQVNPFAKKGNISKHVELRFGDVEGGLDAADEIVKDTWYYAGSAHAPIEPHCAIGEFGPDGVLTVYSSTQVPHYLHRELSRVLEIAMDRIRVIQPTVGGAFGGKSDAIQCVTGTCGHLA